MTPFDLLRSYFTTTGIGQLPSRGRDVSTRLVESVSRSRYSVQDFEGVLSIPSLQEARNWGRQAWEDIDDESFRRL